MLIDIENIDFEHEITVSGYDKGIISILNAYAFEKKNIALEQTEKEKNTAKSQRNLIGFFVLILAILLIILYIYQRKLKKRNTLLVIKKKEIEKVVQNWEEEGISVEKGRWGKFFVVSGKKKKQLAPAKDPAKITLEEAKSFLKAK